MTSKERLHRLVDDLADDQIARALTLLEKVVGSERGPGRRPRLPASLEIGASGQHDVSERVDETLADG